MKFIRFIIRGLATWSLLLFLLGVAFAASPHAGEDVLGIVAFALVAGGVLSLFRRPADQPGLQQNPQEAPADPAPPVVVPTENPLPGARGARMAVALRAADTRAPEALVVSFRGQVKAYVTRDSWHPVGRFAELGVEGPEYRLVALMSVYAQSVLAGSDGVYTEQDAIAYALGELVPHELLEHDLPDPSHTATALGIPADVLTPQNLQALRAAITSATPPRPPRPIGSLPSDLFPRASRPGSPDSGTIFACGRTGAARPRGLPARPRGHARTLRPASSRPWASVRAGIVAWRWTGPSLRSRSPLTASPSRASRTCTAPGPMCSSCRP
jgi:hypothetical protein